MSKNTGDGELDDILMSYTLSLVLDEEKAKTRGKSQEWENAQYNEHLKEAKTAIKKYAAQEANKTAIDELEGILNCWEHPSIAPHFLTDRIAQLKVIQNKLEGLS